MNLFIFHNAIRRLGNEKIKLNEREGIFHFFYNDQEVTIDTNVLRDGSSTMVLHNPISDECYILYNFRELLEVLNFTPSEMLSTLGQRGFMQIDKCRDNTFIKVFLPEGDTNLPSDTHDFSSFKHYTKDYIHPLDWQYSWTIKNLQGKKENEMLHLTFELCPSDFWKNDIYISHAGQTIKLEKGKNDLTFHYVKGNDAYIGNPNCHYKGRRIELERVIEESKREVQ